jgi:hypothetical protein
MCVKPQRSCGERRQLHVQYQSHLRLPLQQDQCAVHRRLASSATPGGSTTSAGIRRAAAIAEAVSSARAPRVMIISLCLSRIWRKISAQAAGSATLGRRAATLWLRADLAQVTPMASSNRDEASSGSASRTQSGSPPWIGALDRFSRMVGLVQKCPATCFISKTSSAFVSLSAKTALFERLQETDEIGNSTRIQSKLRHPWMARRQPLAECIFQRFDWIPFVERAKRRRGGAGAPGKLVDRMTLRTIGVREGLASPNALYVSKCRKTGHDI